MFSFWAGAGGAGAEGRGLRPDVVTYGAAVSACARAGRNARLVSAAARELLATLWGLHAAAAADGLGPDQYMIHCLAVACGRVGDAEGAIRVMDAGAGPAAILCLVYVTSARSQALASVRGTHSFHTHAQTRARTHTRTHAHAHAHAHTHTNALERHPLLSARAGSVQAVTHTHMRARAQIHTQTNTGTDTDARTRTRNPTL